MSLAFSRLGCLLICFYTLPGLAQDNDDSMAALQVPIAKHAQEASEWRDALEVERENFQELEKKGLKPESMLQLFRPGHVIAANAQAPPQDPEPKEYQHSPYDPHPPMDSQKLQEPHSVSSSNGILKTTLVVDWGWLHVKGTGVRVRTRLYNGTYPGPTLRVKRGDLVNITVINKLGDDSDIANEAFPRREGQATYEYPDGIPKDNARYQSVGLTPADQPYDMVAKTNNMHNPNTTNLHTHGWHVSPLLPQDNVLDVDIYPGTSFSYSYQLSSYHSGGNSWYHDHWHGTTTLQTNCGMVGALIIDDSEGEVPDYIAKATQVTMVMHEISWSYFGPDFLKYFPDDPLQACFPYGSVWTLRCALGHRQGIMANISGDRLWKLEYEKGYGYGVGQKKPLTELISVNGQYQPKLSMQTGEWVRLRMVFASSNFPINVIVNYTTFDSPVGACEMQLVSKDNAYLDQFPRLLQRGVWLGAGNRCQVLVRCSSPGTYALQNDMSSYAFSDLDPKQVIMLLNVKGKPTTPSQPEIVQAQRPRYLNSLVDVPNNMISDPIVPPAHNVYNGEHVDVQFPVKIGKTITQAQQYDFPNESPGRTPIYPSAYENQPVRFVINNMTFSHHHPQATIKVADVVELEVRGIDAHSWHMHTHPVQYVGFGFTDYLDRWGGYFEIGDWTDVIQLPNNNYDVRNGDNVADNYTARVRFQTDCYTGPLVIHCHVLYHEDLGMMTWFNSTGKDHSVSSKFHNHGLFKDPPTQCTEEGQQCAPAWCADYEYADSDRRRRRRKDDDSKED